jgi:hypothetical protein
MSDQCTSDDELDEYCDDDGRFILKSV